MKKKGKKKERIWEKYEEKGKHGLTKERESKTNILEGS